MDQHNEELMRRIGPLMREYREEEPLETSVLLGVRPELRSWYDGTKEQEERAKYGASPSQLEGRLDLLKNQELWWRLRPYNTNNFSSNIIPALWEDYSPELEPIHDFNFKPGSEAYRIEENRTKARIIIYNAFKDGTLSRQRMLEDSTEVFRKAVENKSPGCGCEDLLDISTFPAYVISRDEIGVKFWLDLFG